MLRVSIIDRYQKPKYLLGTAIPTHVFEPMSLLDTKHEMQEIKQKLKDIEKRNMMKEPKIKQD